MDHITRIMKDCPGYNLKQVQQVIRNVPALRNISESLVKDIFEEQKLNRKWSELN